jgi:peptide/nickel transport system substrate-binding protein
MKYPFRLALIAATLIAVGVGVGVSVTAQQGNVMRVAIINDPIMNPVIAPDLGSILVNKVIFAGLVRPDDNLRPTPDLARSWQVSRDGLVYTFRLRPGVKWHDGDEFTAEDVKFTFDLARDAKSGSRLASDFAPIDKVDVVDKLTVRFTLKTPFAPFLILLGHNAGIIPEHLLKGKTLTEAAEFNRQKPIGTGPFRVRAVQPGASITLEANPDYYGGKPKLAGVTFKIIPDINVQAAQLRAGELDFTTLEPVNLASVQGASNVKILQANAIQHFFVWFNQRLPIFKPALVREAMNYAVNRQAIIDGVLRGYADYPQGTIPTALKDYYAPNLSKIPFDPERAKRLLAQAGWKPGAGGILQNAQGEPFKFTLLVDKGNPTRENAALAVQQDLKRIGMDVTLQTLEFATVVRDFVIPGKFEANLIWWTTPPDPDQYSFYGTGQSNNNAGYSNPEADRLLLAGRQEPNAAKRRVIYSQLQALQVKDPPVLVLWYPKELQAVNARLDGVPSLGIRDAMRHTEKFFFGN